MAVFTISPRMAQKRKQKGGRPSNNQRVNARQEPQVGINNAGLASAFVTLNIGPERAQTLIDKASDDMADSLYQSEIQPSNRSSNTRQTRGAWHKNLANPKNTLHRDDEMVDENEGIEEVQATNATTKKKTVAFALTPTPGNVNAVNHANSTTTRTLRSDTARLKKALEFENSRDYPSADSNDEYESEEDDTMSAKAAKPSLKLKLGSTISTSNGNTPAQTPNPQSAVRTPSLKLNFGSRPSISAESPAPTPTTIKLKTGKADTNGTSSAKRKRQPEDEDEDEPAPKQPTRKLTLKTNSAKTPITPAPIFKLKTKGKIPKRPAGVGYDSELEDREVDPVILEGFILRMPPGPDCDYVHAAIQKGTIGVSRAQGGADIRMRFLDTAGRRGIIIVNGHQYATTVVDLPCIVEGMKSFDKKGWIKSIDITQMMLVLGRCETDEQAKNFELPDGVDPKTFAYAHGLTAPMHNVRKRRYARTKRARVDDIESVERRVHQLLEADAKAVSVSFQVLNYNPELDQEQESGDEYDDEQDAEAEDEDYFGDSRLYADEMAETPMAVDDGDGDIKQDEIDMFEAAFQSDDENDEPVKNGHASTAHPGGLHPLNGLVDKSVTVTPASGSPAANTSAALTPGTEAMPSDQPQSSDDDESDADDDSDKDDAEKDADENLQQAKERIADMENKIREQTEQLRRTQNTILRKKLAGKIQALRDDVAMMKKSVGLGDEDGDDEGED